MHRLHTLIPIYIRSSHALAGTKSLILGGFNYLNSIITAEILHSAVLQLDLFRRFSSVLLELFCAACTNSVVTLASRLFQQVATATGFCREKIIWQPVCCGAVETEVNKI